MKDIGIGIVAGIAVLVLLIVIDSSIDGSSDSNKSSGASSRDSKQRWCPDALWVRSASMLYQTTYASTSQTITAKNIYAGMEQGGSLSVNYNYQASIGQMSSDIDPSELTAYLVSVANAVQKGKNPVQYASDIVSYCAG
ncbi:hypothetical protein [Streptomyces sp. NPDC003996]